MSEYDIEREKQKSMEIRKAFRELFPLATEESLPWAACQIGDFLRKRIKAEIEEGTNHFVSQVSRVLCEISRPKTHFVDMARIVVEEAKQGRRDRETLLRYLSEIGEMVGMDAKAYGDRMRWGDVGRLVKAAIEKKGA